ncbi:MAG: transglycosylase domain-containing protein [Streptosporangiales bacterium]|nr:transglycosylase domain-containing protein [Streptosporangiales bacterium]MBO0889590.1 transglycosylase domain-containing protein [Acidothermales bacterium]
MPQVSPTLALRNLTLLLVLSLVAGVLAAGIALPAVGAAGLVGKAGADSFESLPANLATPPLPERSRMLDNDGHEIASFYDEYRITVPLSQVAPIMRRSLIAIEDYRFYQHGPLDFKGTLRALAQNQSGSSTQGGSTLTQQYVKLVQVEQANSPDEVRKVTNRQGITGYARKLQELRYATTMEKKYSKDQILERYLNIAYFGSGAYGVEAAARHYFGTTSSKLTLTQSALIAGLVRSPYAYDPTVHPKTALNRRNTVLQRMADTHVITQAQADQAKKTGLGLKLQSMPNGCAQAGSKEGFFCEYAAKEILSNTAFGKTYKDRLNALYRGGLTIRTTLDPKTQKAADKSMRHWVYKSDHTVGSMVMIQPGTGKVRAISISRDFTTSRHAKGGQLNFNTAVDHAHGGGSGAQFGSNAKAFTLAAALNDGIPLGYEINAPGSISNLSGFQTCDGESISYPHVGNSDGESEHGVMNLVDGTVKSVNTFFVELEHKVGLCKTWKMTKKLGMVRSDGKPLGEYPSLTLGSDEVDPLHVSAAYAAFAAQGKYCHPDPFEYVLDANGKRVAGLQPHCSQAMKTGAANAVAKAMEGVLTRGTAKGNGIGRPAAGKTGTTNKNQAGWFTGYTPDLAASISLYDPRGAESHPLKGARVGPRVLSGFGADAAPIWKQAMKDALEGTPKTPFGQPSADLNRAVHLNVNLPDVKGMDPNAASKKLSDAGFTPTVAPGQVGSDQPAGKVAYTDPGGGSSVLANSGVTIYVSNGQGGKPSGKPTSKPTSRPTGHGKKRCPPLCHKPGG